MSVVPCATPRRDGHAQRARAGPAPERKRRAARRLAKVSNRGHDWLAAAGRALFIGYTIDPCAGLSDRARSVGNASASHRVW